MGEARKGTIYFAAAPGRIKVGFSTNVSERIASLNTIDPDTVELLDTMDGTYPLERAIHKTLAPFNVRGEWYRNCPEVRATIHALLVNGPSAIGYTEKPARAVPDPARFDFRYAVASAARLVIQADMLLVDKADLARIVEIAEEISATIALCEAQPNEEIQKLIVDEFRGRCAARALRGLNRT